ncbi:MAG: hypothetical protein V4727_02820 [Verrucomicrobiota bacterium]
MSPRIKRLSIFLLILALYVATYFVCRKVYEAREDEYFTLYDEDSIIALGARLIHSPLIAVDTFFTGRRVGVGNWRVPAPKPNKSEMATPMGASD